MGSVTKICTLCKQAKSIDDYYTKGLNKRDSRCKTCMLFIKKKNRDAKLTLEKDLKKKWSVDDSSRKYDSYIDENGRRLIKCNIQGQRSIFTKG